MPSTVNKNSTFQVVQMVRNLINKLTQTPDIYPIKYYKKSKRNGKNRNAFLL